MKPLFQNIYKVAIQIQDAANPSAVIGEFARMRGQISLNGGGYTQAFKDHPVTILMVNKIASMVPKGADALGPDMVHFSRALEECEAKKDLPVCSACGFIADQVTMDKHRHEPATETAIYTFIPTEDGDLRREIVSLC